MYLAIEMSDPIFQFPELCITQPCQDIIWLQNLFLPSQAIDHHNRFIRTIYGRNTEAPKYKFLLDAECIHNPPSSLHWAQKWRAGRAATGTWHWHNDKSALTVAAYGTAGMTARQPGPLRRRRLAAWQPTRLTGRLTRSHCQAGITMIPAPQPACQP